MAEPLTKTELAELDISRYRRFVEYALDTTCSLAITSSSGAPLVSDGDFEGAGKLAALAAGMRATDGPTIRLVGNAAGSCCAMREIELTGSRDRCLLVLGMLDDRRSDARVGALLGDLAQAIAEDYATLEVLGGLADELSVRYEELNLLYRFDDVADGDRKRLAPDAIARIIEACRDYLPIDMVGVIVPGEALQLHATAPHFAPAAAAHLLQSMRQSRFLQLKFRPESLVINHDDEESLSNTFETLPCKCVIVPLLGVADHVVGMLVMANGMHAPDFTHSNRRLAELVAAEVSRVLQSNRDRLTGLYNRKAFELRLDALIRDARETGSEHMLVYMDLDRFKFVNDIAGHAAGDELLAQGCSLFLRQARPDWFVARLGDDEFGLLIESTSVARGKRIAETIRRRVSDHRFAWGNRTFHTSASLSVVPITGATRGPGDVLAAADVACQLAKDTGRDSVRCYDADDHNVASYHEQMRQASTIREALEENRFELHAQTIAPLQQGGDETHVEILVRMRNRDGELVPPGVFIPAAEKYGMMTSIDRWVVTNAIGALRDFDKRAVPPRISCSINLSGTSLGDEAFLAFVVRCVHEASFEPGRLTFEVTETAAISNLAVALEFMATVRDMGARFALDDFGVGTSSFGNLRTLPVDYVKIDGSFVKSIATNKLDYAVVRSINEISHLMGLKTVAEFVENTRILDVVRATGIDYAQGYGIDEPSPFVTTYGN